MLFDLVISYSISPKVSPRKPMSGSFPLSFHQLGIPHFALIIYFINLFTLLHIIYVLMDHVEGLPANSDPIDQAWSHDRGNAVHIGVIDYCYYWIPSHPHSTLPAWENNTQRGKWIVERSIRIPGVIRFPPNSSPPLFFFNLMISFL